MYALSREKEEISRRRNLVLCAFALFDTMMVDSLIVP